MTDPTPETSTVSQPDPGSKGFDFFRGYAQRAYDSIKPSQETPAETQEAPPGDVGESVGEEPTAAPEPEPKPDKGAGAEQRIHELLAKNKDLESKYEAQAQQLAEFKKKEETAQLRQSLLDALGDNDHQELEESYGISANDTERKVDKVLELLGRQQKADRNGQEEPTSFDSNAKVQALLAEREILTELSANAPDISLSPAQLAAIAEVRQEAPALSVDEAFMLTQRRRPSLFPGTDSRGPNPAVHGTTKPTGRASSERTPKSDRQQEIDHLTAATQTSGAERRDHLLAGLSLNPMVKRAFEKLSKK